MSPVNSVPLPPTDRPSGPAVEGLVSLADGRRGLCGVIASVGAAPLASDAVLADELERRLLEMGFVEGARV